MISLPIWAVVLISILASSIVVTATWAYLTAQRLHRLHKRCEQAAIALEGTLDRRALAARMVARAMRRAATQLDVDTAEAAEMTREANTISHTAHIVEATACPQLLDLRDRETVENDLTLVLRRSDFSQVDHEDLAGLQESALRVNLARRFYNNAVSEALALHTAPMVRFFRLAGHASQPHYFNIIDESWSEMDATSFDTEKLAVEPAPSASMETNSMHTEQD
ncbi:hypothetical protein [Lawsonella clevelandensis]|uniref:LemA family protein n=1 Tax=Lawsonella clevelandensis TaxID=1528099 RepID=A0A0M4MB69_9ACTN|nr:hypothetical protein [Lawsonella clevelandensis]ALE18471.1 hypothetical protein AL705_00575 [Lawsonella clevelandensis]MDU7193576.1 hypothetical protein [Lawsonella clevelandensis]VHN99630.1 hypothetical protein LC603019_00120 [Lawsonella clevelandensis]